MRPNAATLSAVVKRLSVIYYCVFKVFMVLNGLLLGLAFYMLRNGASAFLFVIFFINFWMMMIFFCLLSMYIKLFLCMQHMDEMPDDFSWVYAVIFFPLVDEETEEEFVRLVAQQSLDEAQQQTTQPPTTDRLDELETRWKSVWEDAGGGSSDDACLICANPFTHEYPSHKGIVRLSGCCPTSFHKKCVLEWFHFNEKPDQTDETKRVVTCPSCRHLFSTALQS